MGNRISLGTNTFQYEKNEDIEKQIKRRIPGLSKSCNASKNYTFEFENDMDIKLLKPFFDVKMAFAVFHIEYYSGCCAFGYATEFDELSYVVRKFDKVKITIYGNDETLKTIEDFVAYQEHKKKQIISKAVAKMKDTMKPLTDLQPTSSSPSVPLAPPAYSE
jgi:hypothetical protein